MNKRKRKARNRRLLSSKHHDYQTPEYFLELVRKVAPIGLDPATAPNNPTGARLLIAPPDNGLQEEWAPFCKRDEMVFINPPYGGALKVWAPNMVAQHSTAPGSYMQMALVPARVDAGWFRELCQSADCVLLWSSPTLGSRIRFARPAQRKTGKRPDGAMFPCAVFFWGPQDACDRFMEHFGPHGLLIKCKHIIFRGHRRRHLRSVA